MSAYALINLLDLDDLAADAPDRSVRFGRTALESRDLGAATILYAFGSSTIRGFALVLIIGVLVSMFSAIVVTRTILRWVVRQEWARKPALYGLRDDEFVALVAVRSSSRREARARV